jgi:hypothetical protein
MVVVAVAVDDDLDWCGRQLPQVVEDLARLGGRWCACR